MVSQMEDTPVYRIQLIGNLKAPSQVPHQNMLHPARSVHEDDCQLMTGEVQTALSKANALMEAYFDV